MLFKFLLKRCRDENEADDLVQETFLRAARYRHNLSNRARLRSWVVQIAANVFRDHVRRAQRRPASGCEEELLERVESDEPVPGELASDDPFELGGELVDKEILLAHLRSAFRRLMERDRVVLASYYGGRQSTSSTAADCGIGPELVKVRLFRARRRLERAVRLRTSEHRARRLAGHP